IIGSVIRFSIREQDRPDFQKAFEIAEAEMEKSVKENPLDLRARLFLGRLYTASFQFSGNQEKLILAQQKFEESIAISPNNQQGYWYLAEVKLGMGQAQEAIDLLKKAVELEPLYGRSHWYLVRAYEVTGQYQLAQDSLEQAEKADFNWQEELGDIKEVIKIYAGLQDDASLVPIFLQAIEKAPKDVQLWAGLAASYANLGQFDKAREAVNKMVEINPDSASKAEEFLKSLQQ
ncbi:MAG: tetratricopeptide repeat protein, partial [Candidatus Buchananbacteria bacterium]|nr:tetratricopeptide repeat protein [Candidatus Buchananbacteria bacterium]